MLCFVLGLYEFWVQVSIQFNISVGFIFKIDIVFFSGKVQQVNQFVVIRQEGNWFIVVGYSIVYESVIEVIKIFCFFFYLMSMIDGFEFIIELYIFVQLIINFEWQLNID